MEKELQEYLQARWARVGEKGIRALGLDRDQALRNYTLALWMRQFWEMKIRELGVS